MCNKVVTIDSSCVVKTITDKAHTKPTKHIFIFRLIGKEALEHDAMLRGAWAHLAKFARKAYM